VIWSIRLTWQRCISVILNYNVLLNNNFVVSILGLPLVVIGVAIEVGIEVVIEVRVEVAIEVVIEVRVEVIEG
jgi:hypothetical protein